jgi:hypothetical protein
MPPEDFPEPEPIVKREREYGRKVVEHRDLVIAFRRAVGLATESTWKTAFEWLAKKCEVEL